MTNSSSELVEIAEFARNLACRAGDLIMPYFREVDVEWKPDGTEVTEADRRAEELIREALARQFPRAAILGEEQGGVREPQDGDQWIIDPIDGTASFTLGIPLFGTLIALLRDGEPIVGVIHMPAMEETLFAATGSGCSWKQGDNPSKTVTCSPIASLEQAVVSSTGWHCSELQPIAGELDYSLGPLTSACRKFRAVGDCYQHFLVCRGRLHLAVDAIMAPWDSAAIIPCVREAGGVITDMFGGTKDLAFAGSLLSASDPEVHRQALACMKPRRINR